MRGNEIGLSTIVSWDLGIMHGELAVLSRSADVWNDVKATISLKGLIRITNATKSCLFGHTYHATTPTQANHLHVAITMNAWAQYMYKVLKS